MVNDNGGKERKKKCPLLNEWCIGEACALYNKIYRKTGGMQQEIGICAFNAAVMMLSEINQKTTPPQQKVSLPQLYKGG